MSEHGRPLSPVFAAMAAVATCLLPSCSSEPELRFEAWLFPVPEGTTVREYPQHPPAEPDAVRFVEDLVIGSDAAAEAALYQPSDVAVAEDGTVFVADRGEHRIKVFDADGNWQRNLGAQGQGPGEFDRLDYLTIAGDRLIAYDTRNDRFSAWTLAGEHVADHKPTETRNLSALFGLSDGSLIWSYRTFNPDRTTGLQVERIDITGAPLAALLDGPGGQIREVSANEPVQLLQTVIDSLEDRTFAVTAGGDDVFYFSRAERYQVMATSKDGDPLWALRRAGPPPPLPVENRDSLVAGIEQRFGLDASVSPDDVTWPERVPAIFDLRVDGRQRLFVFLPPEGLSLAASDSWPVHAYSRNGDYLGAGSVPQPWHTARGDHVYEIATNANDEPVVIRYRVEIDEG